MVGVFAGAYLTSTPATLLHPEPFLAALRYEVDHYATGHAGHTVGRGGEHAMRMLAYFAEVVFSAWPVLALPVFGLCLIGIYAVAREGRIGVVLLSFPALYAAYFATQRAMVVRNLLVVVPFLAIVAARGAIWVWERRRGGGLVRPLTVGFLATVVFVNAGRLIWAAETIVDRRTDRFVRETASHLSSATASPVWVSPRLRIHLARLGWVKPGHVVDDARRAERLALYASEGMTRWQEWPANRPGLTERWFGPREVNFDMYPNWWGDDRIIVMSRRQALAVDLLAVAPARFVDSLPGGEGPRDRRADGERRRDIPVAAPHPSLRAPEARGHRARDRAEHRGPLGSDSERRSRLRVRGPDAGRELWPAKRVGVRVAATRCRGCGFRRRR